MAKIKYCIWDVGNVIYDYTIKPLNLWCEQHTTDMAAFRKNEGKFNFNDYMKGLVPYSELCRQICDFYSVPYQEDYQSEITKAFQAGIIKYHPETRKIQEKLNALGIGNCILSNALPILAKTSRCEDIIPPQHQFCSFDLGLLKPDPAIYKAVREKLGCSFEELIFVDDKPKNVKAAAELGIHAVTFNAETIVDDITKLL